MLVAALVAVAIIGYWMGWTDRGHQATHDDLMQRMDRIIKGWKS